MDRRSFLKGVGVLALAAKSEPARGAANPAVGEPLDPYSAIAERYCRDVVAGEVVACYFIRRVCEEHLSDLAAQQDEDCPWRYDAGRAERVCRYVERFPHIKGEWAAAQEKLILTPWMVFATCRLFGMVAKATGLRRFREFYAEIPRKNGKTTLVAAWAHYLAFQDGEVGAEVYVGASKMEQALIAFDTAAQQLEVSGAAKAFRLVISKRQIIRMKDRSRLRAVAKRPGDGGSPHAAVLDELHEHERSDLRDSMIQGMGARRQPLLIQITTAGYDVHGVCYSVRSQAVETLTGVRKNPRLFALIYTLDVGDDPLSAGAYVKANPNLGVSVRASDLEEERLLAKQDPGLAFTYRTKKLNVWGQSRSTYFNVDAWLNKCFDPALLPMGADGKPVQRIEQVKRNPGVPAWVRKGKWTFRGEGEDLAARIDLASRVKIFARKEPASPGRAAGRHYYVFGSHYAPSMTVRNGQHNETYARWAGQGWLTEHDGFENDLAAIQADILHDRADCDLGALAFDQAFALQMQQEIEREVGEGVVWTIPQNAREISDGMKEFGAAIVAGRVHHNGDPVLTMAIGNVVSRPDANENEYPRKEKPENKIDPVTALLNAMNRVMATAEPTSVPYRGLVSV